MHLKCRSDRAILRPNCRDTLCSFQFTRRQTCRSLIPKIVAEPIHRSNRKRRLNTKGSYVLRRRSSICPPPRNNPWKYAAAYDFHTKHILHITQRCSQNPGATIVSRCSIAARKIAVVSVTRNRKRLSRGSISINEYASRLSFVKQNAPLQSSCSRHQLQIRRVRLAVSQPSLELSASI